MKQHGIDVSATTDFCEGFVVGKQHRETFGTRKNRPTVAGEQINTDVCSPMQEITLGGTRYYVCFKDDFSKFRRLFFTLKKSEVVNCLKTFISESEAAGHRIKELLSDGGTEFNNSEVKAVLASKGISTLIAMTYTPEQNGAAERENRSSVKCARFLIHTKELPIKLWAEAINTSVYVLNRTAKTSVPGENSYEVWFKKEKPCIDHLRIFGTECYIYIPKQQRRNWDLKSKKDLLDGYCGDKDGYRMWTNNDKVVLSRDVVFKDEQVLGTM
ncbi:Retrovirus-related Pol polyprotein from transposon TNT 1-94 [Araneus ventricosus]|uniref:Retrovirus-related Pol polyprotein from transposon TNT 1-94 n=1 Tax=Araneus ventricosus TaxID=182803 RepID=A0A4Y2LB33_ARAVE|nr:Retrovirus-related Pol polyprotein from transposon TNT 1-94 [Araneus ventricosus]